MKELENGKYQSHTLTQTEIDNIQKQNIQNHLNGKEYFDQICLEKYNRKCLLNYKTNPQNIEHDKRLLEKSIKNLDWIKLDQFKYFLGVEYVFGTILIHLIPPFQWLFNSPEYGYQSLGVKRKYFTFLFAEQALMIKSVAEKHWTVEKEIQVWKQRNNLINNQQNAAEKFYDQRKGKKRFLWRPIIKEKLKEWDILTNLKAYQILNPDYTIKDIYKLYPSELFKAQDDYIQMFCLFLNCESTTTIKEMDLQLLADVLKQTRYSMEEYFQLTNDIHGYNWDL